MPEADQIRVKGKISGRSLQLTNCPGALQVILMSATLDSDLVARYFGDCKVLAAGGRTFPVEHLFLEDVHELTGYTLDADSRCASKSRASRLTGQALKNSSARGQALLKVRRRQQAHCSYEACWPSERPCKFRLQWQHSVVFRDVLQIKVQTLLCFCTSEKTLEHGAP